MPEVGDIFSGRYRLTRPLGAGGMATIWVAEHLAMGNFVAVKVISSELMKCDLAISRFRREARSAATIRSPYVVQMFDHDVDPQHGPFIAMELLDGENLAERLDREQTLSTTELCRVMQQVSKGLAKAHAADIVHRDIKPENIFLAVDDDAVETAKILDFGVAKADSPLMTPNAQMTVEGALVGTLSYMSPEQAQGRSVDCRTDLWALGVIAFEALVGVRPFDDKAPGAMIMNICAYPIPIPSSSNPQLPAGFDEWFAKACNRDPDLRFASAQELAAELAKVCGTDRQSPGDILPGNADKLPNMEPQPALWPPARQHPALQLVNSEPPFPPDPAPTALVPSGLVEELSSIEVEFELQPEYFVSDGSVTVGPIGLETVSVGYYEAYVPTDALVWTDGWPAWRRASDVFENRPSHAKQLCIQDLEIIGPSCSVPPQAPPLPPPVPVDSRAKPSESTSQPKTASKSPPSESAPLAEPPNPAEPANTSAKSDCSAKPKTVRNNAVKSSEYAQSKQVPAKRTASVSAVRTSSRASKTPDFVYYLSDGVITVGPVRASVLRLAMESGRIHKDTLMWRTGWEQWQPLASAVEELQGVSPAPIFVLSRRPGLECMGSITRLPPQAPPLLPGAKGHLSG